MMKMNSPPPPPHPYIHPYAYQPMYPYPPPTVNPMYSQPVANPAYPSMHNYGYQKQPAYDEQMYKDVHNPFANQATQNKPNMNNSGVKKSYGGGWSSKLK